MKILIFAIILALILPIGAFANSHYLSTRCEMLLETLERTDENQAFSSELSQKWNELRRFAAYTTPFELLRNTNNACEGYLSRLGASEDESEVRAAYAQFRSGLEDIQRIHSMSLELIF